MSKNLLSTLSLLKTGLTIIFVQLIVVISNAQTLETVNAATPPYSPENIVENYFLGEGVEVIDLTIEGDQNAVGFFKGGQSFGIERGMVMSTGRVMSDGNIEGLDAINTSNEISSVMNSAGVTDADISTIAGTNVADIVKLTIDFIPLSDSIEFEYVFASEEYPNFVCGDFNDVFGFFISGPGFTGVYENGAENIALIPGTNLPVSINSINGGSLGAGVSNDRIVNCTEPNGSLSYDNLYNETPLGSQPAFNGYTNVLKATTKVTACELYTLKIVIADVKDNLYDSGVFLAANSFSAKILEVDATTVSLDGTITEGCADGDLTFTLPEAANEDYVVNYTISGDAVMGVDYNNLPSSLTIPAGSTTASLPIVANVDEEEEGLESIIFEVEVNECENRIFEVFIRDNILEMPDLGNDTTVCVGTAIDLDGTIEVNLPENSKFTKTDNLPMIRPFTAYYSDLMVVGVQPFEVQEGVIASVCIDNLEHARLSDVDVYLIAPDGRFIELTTGNGGDGGNGLMNDYYTNTCFTPTATTPINATSGPMLPMIPFTGDWQPEGQWSDLYGAPTNGVWQLMIYDNQDIARGTLYEWSITFQSIYDIAYSWTPSTGLSCIDCPNPTATVNNDITYTLEIADSYGCVVQDDIALSIHTDPEAPVVICENVTDNSITVTWEEVNNATAYEISIDSGIWETPDEITQHTVSGLTRGQTIDFQVRAIGECANTPSITTSCTTDDCSPPKLEIGNLMGVSCFGEADGQIRINASGDAPFLYVLNDTTNNETGFFDKLPKGNYQVIVEDTRGCIDSIRFIIPEPDELMSTTDVVNHIDCATNPTGIATINITGGAFPYNITWDNGEVIDRATQLTAGKHYVSVTDAQGCMHLDSVTIEAASPMELTLSATEASCVGVADGTVTVEVTGGSGNYTYQWDDTNSQTTATATGVTTNLYTVIVTDSDGCVETGSVNVTTSNPMVVSLIQTNSVCSGNDGMARAVVSGGVPPYNYSWSEGTTADTVANLNIGRYEITITDANGCTTTDEIDITAGSMQVSLGASNVTCFEGNNGAASAQVTGGSGNYTYQWNDPSNSQIENVENLPAGTYTVTVSDIDGGCTVTEMITILEPDELTVIAAAGLNSCEGSSDGTASATVYGGTGPYIYQWNDASNQTTETAINLVPGVYTVTVTDRNGCETVDVVDLENPQPLVLDIEIEHVRCFGETTGTVNVTPSGGAGQYYFQWSNPAYGDINQLTDLAAGEYALTVVDAVGCQVDGLVTILEPLDGIQATITGDNALCEGSNVAQLGVEVQGGQAPYTYLWTTGSTSDTVGDLTAGNYGVTVSDSKGCTQIVSTTIKNSPSITIDFDIQNLTCEQPRGYAEAIVTGGTAPYLYNWSNDVTGARIDNIREGMYIVSVTDEVGCTQQDTISLTPPDTIAVHLDREDVSCSGERDGLLFIDAEGGTGNYTYSLDGTRFGSNSQFSDLPSGIYRAYVRDDGGCVGVSEDMILEEPEPLEVTLGDDIVVNWGDQPQLFSAVRGGTGAMSYHWEVTDTTTISCVDCAEPFAITEERTIYNLIVEDENGCIATEDIIVYVKKNRTLFVPTGFTPNLDGKNDLLNVFGRAGTTVNKFQIFDRWGELVYELSDFQVNDESIGWDGNYKNNPMNSDVFIWRAEVTFTDGAVEFYNGETTLIR